MLQFFQIQLGHSTELLVSSTEKSLLYVYADALTANKVKCQSPRKKESHVQIQ